MAVTNSLLRGAVCVVSADALLSSVLSSPVFSVPCSTALRKRRAAGDIRCWLQTHAQVLAGTKNKHSEQREEKLLQPSQKCPVPEFTYFPANFKIPLSRKTAVTWMFNSS